MPNWYRQDYLIEITITHQYKTYSTAVDISTLGYEHEQNWIDD